jgi:4-hydroxybenzoate polyprenyltransferase
MFYQFLRLVRIPLVFTAVADPITGYIIGTRASLEPLTVISLILVSSCLYMSGMIFNDVADLKRDRVTRPGRPLPSGDVSIKGAVSLGVVLLFLALLLGLFISYRVGILTACMISLILGYDFLLKRGALAGSVCMGIIRGTNISLGFVASGEWSIGWWMLCPLTLTCYTGILTFVSTLEETPEPKLYLDMVMLMSFTPLLLFIKAAFIPAFIASVMVLSGTLITYAWRHSLTLRSEDIRHTVLIGLLAIILLDGAMLFRGGYVGEGFGVLSLLVPAVFLRIILHIQD